MDSSEARAVSHNLDYAQHRALRWLWLGYAALLIYATLFPLDDWDWGAGGLADYLVPGVSAPIPRSDAILNLLVYIPFGLVGMLCLPGSVARRAVRVVGLAALLSALLELGQTYLPSRISSAADLGLNTLGALIGALAAGTLVGLPLARRGLNRFQAQLHHSGSTRLAVVALAAWLLSQWAPLIPSLDPGHLWRSLAPLHAVITGEAPLSPSGTLRYLCMTLGIGGLCLAAFRPGRTGLIWLLSLTLLALAGRTLVAERTLSAHALAGMLLALPLLVAVASLGSRRRQLLRNVSLLGLLGFLFLDNLIPANGAASGLRNLNWIPFRSHMNSVTGVVNLLEVIWVYIALAWVAAPCTRQRWLHSLLTLLVLAGSFMLEWLQQAIPGRYPDITEVLVAVTTWWLASTWPRQGRPAAPPREPAHSRAHTPPARPNLLPWLLGGAVLIAVAWISLRPEPAASYRLPAIADLPSPELPAWREEHPRLPTPSEQDVRILERDNPAFLRKHREQANRGKLYSRILMARVEPGSVDLESLHADLIALEPSWRGHEQTRPLAVGYDWLHDQWSEGQRQQLLERVQAACDYQIHVITDKYSLSPYNVYLYNSPLQALMMAAIASHGDGGPDRCMRFAADYWRHRVLPVWRQVMGTRGGWHEGGEYVGIGIGQAVYQLPALWRHATGEDLFRTEPGLRGFLDFALHRTRPDGTHIRMGDAAHFQRGIPDLAALALEYGHRAAYRLADPPGRPTPLAWPWGPLSRPPAEVGKDDDPPPTAAWFDGIGLLLARTDWSRDATFVSFKAGDHYWSHSHLDQGHFSIFRGGPLALDSGLYNRYGSDHHLNYTAQSVAHNLVTVTDPDDRVAMPPRKQNAPERQIANDGGQRRVGSGWGRAAPLDLAHWRQQVEHYRTVGDRRWGEDGALVWKVADLTPAYTNSLSGTGDFAARTRRVEDYQRTFVFDRAQNRVVILDRIVSSDPDFRKKWLLHSRFAPRIDGRDFLVEMPPGLRRDLRGGSLTGRVLLPASAQLVTIGGRGFEFFVDSRNYDEDGQLPGLIEERASRRGSEPGAWRLEVQPANSAERHDFLVVMQVGDFGEDRSLPEMRIEHDGGELRLHIKGAAPGILVLPAGSEDKRVRWLPHTTSAASH